MKIFKRVISSVALLTLISCGGGGNGGGNGGGVDPVPVVSMSEVTNETQAIEKSGQFAKFQISRTGGSAAVSVGFTLSGNADPEKRLSDRNGL
jgi:hypothetical protein